ncbi:MAG: hypothetical protein KGL74_09315 [Elusimicrobia bacterium]|nr:hypothetical protein [Elusimicrobiota bacterium]
MVIALLIAALATAAHAAAPAKTEISQDITVHARAAAPSLAVPPPSPAPPLVDEVLNSLRLGRGAGEAPPETVHTTPESVRLEQPFPDPPFLALSPENIQALYDSWTFQVRAVDGDIVYRADGVGLLRDKIEWDGAGPDGRLNVAAGRRYRYKFTGRRGGREFVVESDPVSINSFTHREYAGETRLEVAPYEIFVEGKASYATGADRYLDAMTDALRAGEPRRDGTFRFELYAAKPRAKLTLSRVRALKKRISASLRVDPARVKIAALPVERGEGLAVLVPPSKGPRLRIE